MQEKNIIIINSYPNSEEKLLLFKKYLLQLKKIGCDIMLISHLTLPTEIIELSNYYIYDNENFMLPKEKSPVTWFANNIDSINIYSYRHSYAIVKNICTALSFVNKLGYKKFIFSEYDTILTDAGIEKFEEIFDFLSEKNKKAFFFKLENQIYNTNNILYKTVFFAGVVDFFLNNIPIINSYGEWCITNVYASNYDLLESIFFQLFNPFKNEIHLEDTDINEYFNGSKFDVNHIWDNNMIIYNNHNPNNPIFFKVAKNGIYSLYIDGVVLFENKYFNEGEQIRYDFFISDKDTAVKMIYNNKTILDKVLSIYNIAYYKEYTERVRYKKKISLVIAAYFGHRNHYHPKYLEDKLFYIKKQLEYCNNISEELYKIYIPCTFDVGIDKNKILSEIKSYDWKNQIIVYERENVGGSYSSWHNSLLIDNGDSDFIFLIEDDHVIENSASIDIVLNHWIDTPDLFYLCGNWQSDTEWKEEYQIWLNPHAAGTAYGMINNKMYHSLRLENGIDFRLINKHTDDFNLRFSYIVDNQRWFLENYRLAGYKIMDWKKKASAYFPHSNIDFGKTDGPKIYTSIEKFIDV